MGDEITEGVAVPGAGVWAGLQGRSHLPGSVLRKDRGVCLWLIHKNQLFRHTKCVCVILGVRERRKGSDSENCLQKILKVNANPWCKEGDLQLRLDWRKWIQQLKLPHFTDEVTLQNRKPLK